jgi:hypothetical protein
MMTKSYTKINCEEIKLKKKLTQQTNDSQIHYNQKNKNQS